MVRREREKKGAGLNTGPPLNVSAKIVSYSDLIASAGQAEAQAPQSVHFEASIR